MEFWFKILVVTILLLCLLSSVRVVAYYTAPRNIQMEAKDITSEGPNCWTPRWHMKNALVTFDDALHDFCNASGTEALFARWRMWLEREHGITMY